MLSILLKKKVEEDAMLLTVTMNPSVDISYRLEEFVLDDVNRTAAVLKTAGGKGLNVARVARQTGVDVAATGIIGGHLGNFITDELATTGIQQEFFKIDQESRNCIAILHQGMQSEILESGPEISEAESVAFMAHFQELISRGTFKLLTVSGSLPSGMEPSVYREMVRAANLANIPVVLDASGANLLAVLEDDDLLLQAIKPNLSELSAIEGREFGVEDVAALKKVLQGERYKNCEWIILSLGGNGALVKAGADFYSVKVPAIEVVSPVGSGDATVAGFAKGFLKEESVEIVMKTAMTTGVLNTMNAQTGAVDIEMFEEIFKEIQPEIFEHRFI